MGLTIRDVARVAGVSTATVSRALRGLENVDPATRDRIVSIAREMQFSVSPVASRLATGRAGTIGIVTPFIARWYFTEVFAGVEEGLQPFDVNLILHSTGRGTSPVHPVRAHERMRRRVDGILVIGLPASLATAEGLLGLDVPVVLLGSCSPGMSSVSIDDRLGARTAVEHLIEHGHERIGLISGEPLPTVFVPENDRLAGYLDALARHGLPTDEALREPGYFAVRGGERAMETLLALRPRPTAVFCMSDETAFGAMHTMSRQGLTPGRDIAIVGFDGHDLAEAFDLSTVAQPVRDLGRLAARQLMDLVGGSTNAEVTVLPTTLHARGSSGC